MGSKTSWRLITAAAFVVVGMFPGGDGRAAETGQLTVSATVQSGCSLTGGTLNFGTYVSGQTNDLDVAGAINFANCATGTLVFALDGGTNGNENDRKMKSGESTLSYQIHRTAARNANWGTGANSQSIQLLATQSGKIDVYGRIPKNQAIAAGAYTDTVTITMTF